MAAVCLLFASYCAHLALNLTPGAKSSAAINWCHSTEDREAVMIYTICGLGMLIPFVLAFFFFLYIYFFTYLNEDIARRATII